MPTFSSAAHLAATAAALQPHLALGRSTGHHFRHESFDFAGLALAAAASWFGIPGPGEPVLSPLPCWPLSIASTCFRC